MREDISTIDGKEGKCRRLKDGLLKINSEVGELKRMEKTYRKIRETQSGHSALALKRAWSRKLPKLIDKYKHPDTGRLNMAIQIYLN